MENLNSLYVTLCPDDKSQVERMKCCIIMTQEENIKLKNILVDGC